MMSIASVTELGKMCVVVAGVAAMMNDLSHAVYYAANPLPEDKEAELEHKYGRWAVSIAKASCPFGDIECIEREARRLLISRERRIK